MVPELEIDLMRQKQLSSASAIRANKDLYESVKDQIKIEEKLLNARKSTKEAMWCDDVRERFLEGIKDRKARD